MHTATYSYSYMLGSNNSTSEGHNNLSGHICMEISSYEVIIKLRTYTSLPPDSISYEYLNFYCIAVQYYSSYNTIYQHNTGHW